jgi:hypothetical protein
VLVAPEGAGKSTLLAHWSDRYGRAHPEVAVVVRYAGHPSRIFDHVLLRAARELSDRFGLGYKVDLGGPGAPLLRTILTEAAAHGRVVLVLDGLDQASSDRELSLDWLAAELPPPVNVICSARPGAVVERLRQSGARIDELPELSTRERRALIQHYLALYGKSLSEKRWPG